MITADKYQRLSPGELRPRGWLKKQLRIQADGLSGHLDKIWPDIRDSRWIGGNREGWERVPYWLDGFIPLAFLLRDDDLIERARFYVDSIISRQKPDGWLCPCEDDERAGYDVWAAILICKTLTVWADFSGEEDRVAEVLKKALGSLDVHTDSYPLKDWGKSRWGETLVPIFWLYRRTGNEKLVDFARKLKAQGEDWPDVFRDGGVIDGTERVWTHQTHVVNLAMALKYETLYSMLDGAVDDSVSRSMLDKLFRCHGNPYGHFNGDECLAGTSPIRGSELCGLAEAMYSYECLLFSSGEPFWADKLETVAFNGFPATFTPDMWAHQYDQQPNQIGATPMPRSVFGSNGGYSNIFGLEPNYGCCTANLSQGFPKLASSVAAKSGDGIISLIPVDCSIDVETGGVRVKITVDGGYPFRGELTYTVECDKPVEFTLGIRVPSTVSGALIDGVIREPGKICALRRVWSGRSTVKASFSYAAKIETLSNGLSVVHRGALLFALPIDGIWEKREYTSDGVERRFPYCDWFARPDSEWAFALTSDSFEAEECYFDTAFQPDKPPLKLKAKAAPITWGTEYGCCKAYPDSTDPIGNERELTLIPYGCTCLRMTELPFIG